MKDEKEEIEKEGGRDTCRGRREKGVRPRGSEERRGGRDMEGRRKGYVEEEGGWKKCASSEYHLKLPIAIPSFSSSSLFLHSFSFFLSSPPIPFSVFFSSGVDVGLAILCPFPLIYSFSLSPSFIGTSHANR